MKTALLLLLLLAAPLAAQEPLKACATVPDLGRLCEEVGGSEVKVVTFAQGPEDPHHIEAKPNFVRDLASAELLLLVGMDLETGWLPALLEQCRNPKVLKTGAGYFDASKFITPLEVPAGEVDRTQGDVHAHGNPHYLSDPICGLRVARGIRDKLSELRPARKEEFEKRYQDFRKRLGARLVGEKLTEKYDIEKLARLHEFNKLGDFLKKQGETDLLSGWLKDLMPHHGVKAVADHNIWAYFGVRFGLKFSGFLEPLPGISPTTRHLNALIETMKSDGAKLILSVTYFDKRHAEFVASKTSAKVVTLAHQSGAVDGASDYLSTVDLNVQRIVAALK